MLLFSSLPSTTHAFFGAPIPASYIYLPRRNFQKRIVRNSIILKFYFVASDVMKGRQRKRDLWRIRRAVIISSAGDTTIVPLVKRFVQPALPLPEYQLILFVHSSRCHHGSTVSWNLRVRLGRSRLCEFASWRHCFVFHIYHSRVAPYAAE